MTDYERLLDFLIIGVRLFFKLMFAVGEYLVAFVAAFDHRIVMLLGIVIFQFASGAIEFFGRFVRGERDFLPLRLSFGVVFRATLGNDGTGFGKNQRSRLDGGQRSRHRDDRS